MNGMTARLADQMALTESTKRIALAASLLDKMAENRKKMKEMADERE